MDVEPIETRPHVVVADDDPHVCSALSRVLLREGYRVLVAGDGEGALALCRKHRPRLLLVDRAMPPPFYFEIAETLHAELGADAPRIVLITGSGQVSLPESVDAVLAKPFAVDELRSVLDRFAK